MVNTVKSPWTGANVTSPLHLGCWSPSELLHRFCVIILTKWPQMFVIQAHSDPNQLCLVPKCETGMGLRQVLVSAGGCWWILLVTGGCWWDLPATPELTPPTPLHSSSQKHQLPLLLSVNLLYEIWHWNASLIKQITAVISYRINKAIVDITLDFSFLLSVKHFFSPIASPKSSWDLCKDNICTKSCGQSLLKRYLQLFNTVKGQNEMLFRCIFMLN